MDIWRAWTWHWGFLYIDRIKNRVPSFVVKVPYISSSQNTKMLLQHRANEFTCCLEDEVRALRGLSASQEPVALPMACVLNIVLWEGCDSNSFLCWASTSFFGSPLRNQLLSIHTFLGIPWHPMHYYVILCILALEKENQLLDVKNGIIYLFSFCLPCSDHVPSSFLSLQTQHLNMLWLPPAMLPPWLPSFLSVRHLSTLGLFHLFFCWECCPPFFGRPVPYHLCLSSKNVISTGKLFLFTLSQVS